VRADPEEGGIQDREECVRVPAGGDGGLANGAVRDDQPRVSALQARHYHVQGHAPRAEDQGRLHLSSLPSVQIICIMLPRGRRLSATTNRIIGRYYGTEVFQGGF